MTDLLWAVVGGVVGSVTTLVLGLIGLVRVWGERGVKIGELRRSVKEVEADNDDLEQRVRQNKEILDRHIGSYKAESLCTRSES